MKNLYAWFALLILLVLFGIVGKMDLADSAVEHIRYCADVAESVYLDYDQRMQNGECDEKVIRDLQIFLK